MPGARIGAVHGTVHPVDPTTGAANAQTYAMYHPAAALRASSLKQTMLEDMAGLPQVLIDARARRAGSLAEPVAVSESAAAAEVSVAVQLTVVVPFGKLAPDGGLQTTTTPGQLSEAVVV